jgi:hypothetical protein
LPDVRDIRHDEPAIYRICLNGVLDASWTDMLADMTLASEPAENQRFVTTLKGRVADQAALMGVLNLVYDLGLTLLSVECEGGPPSSGVQAPTGMMKNTGE